MSKENKENTENMENKENKEIYLDNSATTKIDPQILKIVARIAEESYGNPSSIHRKGREAERNLNASRKELAGLLGVKDNEIIFTSGGTEANNMAILGLARRYRKKGNHLITTAIEHPSILEPFLILEKEGFEVTYLPPDSQGIIEPQSALQALRPETILVSIMHVNNETGALQPIAQVAALLKKEKKELLLHTDAVQSFGKIPLPPGLQGIDALSISAHKFHGPKGTGALFLRDGILLTPLLGGGGQERGLRPGTENTPGIAGMVLAARQSYTGMKERSAQLRQMKRQLLSSLEQRHPWIRLNGPRDESETEVAESEGISAPKEGGARHEKSASEERSAPHIINISFPGIKGEIIVHALGEQGIFVSTGAACHSRAKSDNHVLSAMGVNEERRASAIRFSLSALTKPEEIIYAAEKINETVSKLKELHEKMAPR